MASHVRTCNRRQLVATGLALPLAVTRLASAPATAERSNALSGTFLQLLSEHQKWAPAQWLQLFDALQRLRLTYVVVQWVMSDGQRFYARQDGAMGQAPLETILELADKTDVRVMIGLVHDPDYWLQIARPPQAVTAYLAERESRIIKTVTEVLPLARSRRSFAGWFMNEEIADVSWREPTAGAVLRSYLHRMSDYLHLVVPDTPVALSGFSNADTTPSQLQDFWHGLLRAAPAIDTVLFQDGIGAHKLTLERLPLYLRAVRAATNEAGRRLWAVTELFEQTGGEGVDQGPFKASAAPFTRVSAQLQIEVTCAAAQIAFSAADYMLAPTRDAQALLGSYLQYLRALNP